MKSLTLRSSVALAFALSLAGCGGNGNLTVGGTVRVFGAIGGAVVLENIKNGDTQSVALSDLSSYYFTNKLLRSDEDFEIRIKADSIPTGLECALANAKGRTGSFAIQNVNLTCAATLRNLTGTITLNGGITLKDVAGLVLVNGSDSVTVLGDKTKIDMAQVRDGSHYGVTILTQPEKHTCTVVNGVNTMGHQDAAFEVSCI